MEARMPELQEQLAQLEKQQNEPHWAIELLLDPKVPLPELTAGEDYPNCANQEQALSLFDPSAPGWVPTWFPREMFLNRWTAQEQMVRPSPQQRLDWFDKALTHYAPKTLAENGPESSTKQTIALSLLLMYCAAESQEIPTPDKL
jgi:hypothetical protein